MERLTALLSVHRRAVTRESEAAMFLHFPHNTAYTIAGRPLLRFLAPSGPRAPLRRRDVLVRRSLYSSCRAARFGPDGNPNKKSPTRPARFVARVGCGQS